MKIQSIREKVINLAGRDIKLAMEEIEVLFRDYGNQAWIWSLRAGIHERLNDVDAALTSNQQAIELSSRDPAYLFARARILVSLEEYYDAAEFIKEALQREKTLDTFYYTPTSLMFLAFCHCKLGKFDEAFENLRLVDDNMTTWIDQLRSKEELIDICNSRSSL